jgi:hypothetical protein
VCEKLTAPGLWHLAELRVLLAELLDELQGHAQSGQDWKQDLEADMQNQPQRHFWCQQSLQQTCTNALRSSSSLSAWTTVDAKVQTKTTVSRRCILQCSQQGYRLRQASIPAGLSTGCVCAVQTFFEREQCFGVQTDAKQGLSPSEVAGLQSKEDTVLCQLRWNF